MWSASKPEDRRIANWLSSAAAAGLLAVVGSLVACDPPAAPPAAERDLALLQLMLRLDGAHRAIAPHLRSPQHMDEIARLAEEIGDMADDPLFSAWPQQPGNLHDPLRYDRLRRDLREQSMLAAAAARDRDLTALHRAYALMDASCTACHKRFSPTY